MAHPSLKRADEFLEVFNRKFDKKYSSIESFNAARKPYWQMILTGMERAEACKSCPFVRAIVAMEVAVRAGHAGMLPPKASAKMFLTSPTAELFGFPSLVGIIKFNLFFPWLLEK